LFKSSVIVSICLTYRFRVTVSALLSFDGLAHQLLLPLAAFKCDMFEQIKFNLIFKKNSMSIFAVLVRNKVYTVTLHNYSILLCKSASRELL